MNIPCVSLLQKLENNQTPFNIVNFLSTNKDIPLKLANNRFNKVINIVKRHFDFDSEIITLQDIYPFVSIMLNDYLLIEKLEKPKRNELIQLAINLVVEETGIDKDLINFNVKLLDSPIRLPTNEIITKVVNLGNNNSELHLKERGKRRIINSITAGAGVLSHYMYYMISDELKNILGNNDIINSYSRMVSMNDLMYWLVDVDENSDSLSNLIGGNVSVEVLEGKPTINVVANNFPILLHELTKGIYEIISIHGLPVDDETTDYVVKMEDTLDKELWDLRIGPSIWEKIYEHIPSNEVYNKELIQFMLMTIYKLPPDDFFELIYKILNDDATIEMRRIIAHSKELLIDYRLDGL